MENNPFFSKIPPRWQIIPFGQVLIDNKTRNGVYKTKEFHGSGIKIVNMGELFAFERIGSQPMKRVQLTTPELERLLLKKGDLLFARRSLIASGAGKCSLVIDLPEPTTFESSIILARPNTNIANPEFLLYFFKSPYGKYLIGTILRQVAVSGITGSDLINLPILLPPLSEQNDITQIFGSLDDKIDLNHRMNHTLEEMARTIFRSWFVDFDPVRARAEGRDTGLPAEIATLFPDSFDESPLGEIPKGWKNQSLLDLANLLSGGTPKTSVPEFWDGDINWVSAKDVSKTQGVYVIDTEKKITNLGVSKSNAKILPKNTTIITARGTVGAYALLGKEMAINQTNYGLQSKIENGEYFLFYLIATLMNELKQNAYGTIFDTITTTTFRETDAVLPPSNLIRCFDSFVSPFMQQILTNTLEIGTLTLIRNQLLPNLMAGESRIL
jgi:type I restriction enzyme, S subunit